MPKKPKQIAPLSIRISPELEERLAQCSARTKQSKNALARDALEAAVQAIEQNDYRLVVPIAFHVTHVPAESGKTEAPAARGGRPAADAGGRSSGSTRRQPSAHGVNEPGSQPAPRLVDSPAAYGARRGKPGSGSPA